MRRMTFLGFCVLGLSLAGSTSRAQAPGDIPRTEADLISTVKAMPGVQIIGKMVFKLFDENGDNKISQQEATNAGNLFVGGFFFSADTNGDGVLSEEEMNKARDAFLDARPWVKYAVETAGATQTQEGDASSTPDAQAKALFVRLDTNRDNQLQASELRQAVKVGIQALYAMIDTDRDGQLTLAETEAGVETVGRMAGELVFQHADTDRNGQISRAEFEKAIMEPARVAFAVADLNHDGQISLQELQSLRAVVMNQLQLPSSTPAAQATRTSAYTAPATAPTPPATSAARR